MQKLLELKHEFFENCVGKDGLEKSPDNGILFLAIFVMLLKEAGMQTQLDLDNSFRALQTIRLQPGLYCRRDGYNMLEAHDNYVGICAVSTVFKFASAREIVEYGTSHGFAYDNISPDTPDPRSIRQGGEIAFYKICAGFAPTIWELAWLIGGLLITIYQGGAGHTNLAWLRLRAMRLALRETSTIMAPSAVSVLLISGIFNIVTRKRYGGIHGSFREYFGNHPITRFAEELAI